MIELDENLYDIVGHGEVYLSFLVVPIERDSDISFSPPVLSDFIVELEIFHDVVGVLIAFVLDTEVVNDEGELDGSCPVDPEAGH